MALTKKLNEISDSLNRVRPGRMNVIMHIIFWVLYFAFLTFIATQSLPLQYAIQRNLLIVIFNSLVFYINFLWIMPEYFERGDLRSYAFAMIGMMILATPLQYFIEVTFFSVPDSIKLYTYNVRYVVLIAISCFIFLMLSTLLRMSMSRYYFERELLELKAIKFEAELKFLREQINPHFLFNSINNIYSLSLENSPNTPDMILKLSELLRYMLYDCNHPFVALESEVKCISSIIELFQLKYPDPVDVRFVVKGDLKDKMIVPNLFTPLVENAFKHGDFGTNKKAFLDITCVARSSYIYFSVKNSKSPILEPLKGPGGIGIQNLKRRFQINYEPSGQIKFEDEKNIFSAAMKIPLPR
ncbi:MAG: sensor histidine kinase [Bacteroidetes bacterium]|nr:sensor histidine kinase [Bacteroidota bacterium]MBS1618082.1 sensor histidine kinase [Bacteroidota bacterium]